MNIIKYLKDAAKIVICVPIIILSFVPFFLYVLLTEDFEYEEFS